MHKKLEADLISLAHSILQMKNKENVFLLKQKSKEVYEKLSVLAFVEEYVNSTPNLKETKEELMSKVEKAFEVKEAVVKEEDTVEEILSVEYKEVAEITEQPFDELEEIIFSEKVNDETDLKNEEVKEVTEKKTLSLEEELQDTISVDVIANLFEKTETKSLNDKLSANIQIGLNDRIVFVKNLFDGSQEDFNRVISQLNTFKTEKEAKKFISKTVKPDYDWSNHQELEVRFLEIIERKFA